MGASWGRPPSLPSWTGYTVSSVQSLSHVQLFVTPWTAACQASLSFTVFRSLLKFMSTESVMPSNHLILCIPLAPPALNPSQHQGLSQGDGSSHQVVKVLHFSFSISPSSEYSISLKMDWFDLLAVQGTFGSLLQHHSLKASIIWCSAFFMVHLSQLYVTTGKTIALTYTDLCP